jgi:flavin-dependent dehydrogenase
MSSYDVIVVGGGPAGCTVACLLAQKGVKTLLLEEKRVPREKLCGAFITPECFPTLNRLGVFDEILGSGAQRISEVRLVAPSGRGITTNISAVSAAGNWALSLSRSRMDSILFERAKTAGAVCIEGMAVKRGIFESGRASGVECLSLSSGETEVFRAPVVVDASGRNSRLSLSAAERMAGRKGSRLYALKASLQNGDVVPERVELYFFKSGYGGLSLIEGGLINLCFMTTERSIKEAGRDPARVLEQTIMTNPAARQRLEHARVVGKWLSAGPLSFGHRGLFRDGIIAAGDAAGMIDPFTGTGIQIALRSGETLAECILQAMGRLDASQDQCEELSGLGGHFPTTASEVAASVSRQYAARYKSEFGRRMAVSGLLRFAAFSPRAAGVVATLFARAPRIITGAFRGTRLGATPSSDPFGPPRQIMELSAPEGVSND